MRERGGRCIEGFLLERGGLVSEVRVFYLAGKMREGSTWLAGMMDDGVCMECDH